ncbi:tRNA modification GTPase [Palleronia aestuarii]|uniref:tRNA modification GTPase MnmE n=1 Tax=Palleronia aestuarii TaxID=568105 RepID=A0A2W7NEW0_9RHOB|nr:tRNA uridine-5-carboxymethylaminomethyl(34) synthesis GTPase MnmE [Palleronia aestuarii]PZX18971.1 tRNA modification GTPase [Palleronia aestuarii]
MDTIFAQATVPGKSGVAIVRVSGPSALHGCARLIGSLPEPNRAALRTVRRADGSVLDVGLIVTFQNPASFTGEDSVEFQVHGSIAVVGALLSELQALPDFRMADAGEFTRRALMNNRLDLVQVEGLADLIDAETEAQRQQAQRVFSGELSDLVQSWRDQLIAMSGLLEASLDFSDEDIPEDVWSDVMKGVASLKSDLEMQIFRFSSAERVRDGFEVAIIGPPNVGKSTLLNAIAKRPVALTSEIAGTTRDVIELRTDIRGLPVTFLDTAGLRDSQDDLERAGIALARDRSKKADLRIYLTDEPARAQPFDTRDIVLHAKADLSTHELDPSFPVIKVSGLTGKGIAELLSTIADRLVEVVPIESVFTRKRHLVALKDAVIALIGFDDLAGNPLQYEFGAEKLRTVIAILDGITGRIDVEDVLGDIFTSFCIGK